MARNDYPLGNWLYMHQIRAAQLCEGIQFSNINASNDINGVADRMIDLGLAGTAIKINDGVIAYNNRRVLYPVQYADDLVRPLVKAIHLRSRRAIAWQFTYGSNPEREAEEFAERYVEMGFRDGAIMNAEVHYKNNPGAATRYASRLRQLLPNECIGLSTFRWPSSHPDFPYKQFAPFIDYWQPQIYWVFADNPRQQLLKSINELRAVRDIPVIPAGYLYSEHGDKPTIAEIKEYQAAVEEFSRDGLMLPGSMEWEWWNAWRNDFWDVLRDWDLGDIQPEPQEPEPPLNNAELTIELRELKRRVSALEGNPVMSPIPNPSPAPTPTPATNKVKFDIVGNVSGGVNAYDKPHGSVVGHFGKTAVVEYEGMRQEGFDWMKVHGKPMDAPEGDYWVSGSQVRLIG